MKTKRLNVLRLIQDAKDGVIRPTCGILPFTTLMKACARCGDLNRACRVLAENISYYGEWQIGDIVTVDDLELCLRVAYCI